MMLTQVSRYHPLPNQRRWGVDRLEGFLGPLVEKGLKSVILFWCAI